VFVSVKFCAEPGTQSADVLLRLWTNLEKVAVFEAEGDAEVDYGSLSARTD